MAKKLCGRFRLEMCYSLQMMLFRLRLNNFPSLSEVFLGDFST